MMHDPGHILAGKVALVTGASRGIGKGIAQELGRAGATVYITARHFDTDGDFPGTAQQTAEEITQAGGRGIAIKCDHSNDDQIASVFNRIAKDHGRLDILVNNVFPAPDLVTGPDLPGGTPFWEAPVTAWDVPMRVGLRSHYVASVYAMPMLLSSGGLIVNISSGGAYIYYESTAYGVGKAALDRMTRDMAHEIADRPVTIVSVWPGMVATELAQAIYKKQPEATEAYLRMSSERARKATAQMQPDQSLPDANAGVPEITSPGGDAWAMTESVRFTGRAVVALASDPNVRSKTGRPFSVVGLADEYGFTDVDGRTPDPFHFRDVKIWAPLLG